MRIMQDNRKKSIKLGALVLAALSMVVASWSCVVRAAGGKAHQYRSHQQITVKQVRAAQKEWGNAIVAIGQAYTDKKNYKKIAAKAVSKLYAYNYEQGKVLFKPTKTQVVPFRGSYKSALSYFVGGNRYYGEDKGFALQPWKKVIFHNNAMYFHGDVAIAMGGYDFVDRSGHKTKVKYTFGYVETKKGQLKIFLHHSSLPYQP